jgi:hypothetical protein
VDGFCDVLAAKCCPHMKKTASKIILFTTLLALAGLFVTPAVRAQADDMAKKEKAEKKSKREAENLKKYDKNANGKLDADEEAAMKADMEKAKAEKKEKKGKKEN